MARDSAALSANNPGVEHLGEKNVFLPTFPGKGKLVFEEFLLVYAVYMTVLTALQPHSSLKCDILSFTLKQKVLKPSLVTGAHTHSWAGGSWGGRGLLLSTPIPRTLPSGDT